MPSVSGHDDVSHLPLVAERFPEARFVHVVRDGSDVALSLLEALVADPGRELRALATWLELPYDPSHAGPARRPAAVPCPAHHRRLALAPTPGLRDWRREMSQADAARFEAVASDALAELAY